MIFIAMIISVLGSLAPKWILKGKYDTLRNEYNWSFSFIKLSGLITCLLISFILISTVTFSTKDRFIENKNAIYGLSYSEAMKGFGFEDGNQIISINGETDFRVSEIIERILLSQKEAKITIQSTSGIKEVIIKQNEMRPLIQYSEMNHVQVIMKPKEYQNPHEQIKITEKNNGLGKAFESYRLMWKQVTIMFSPKKMKAYSQIGGYFVVPKANNFKGYVVILGMSLIFIGLLNFIPLPGFSVGNFITSIIESIRRKRFSNRLLNISKMISICLVVIIIFVSIQN